MSEDVNFTDVLADIREDLDKLEPEVVDKIVKKMAEIEQSAIGRRDVYIEELKGSLTKNRVGFYALGMGVGAITGYFVARRLLETKYSKIADDEIAEMREHYRARARALEAEAAKRPVEEIVKERGYSSPDAKAEAPPMAVPPPAAVAEGGDNEEEAEPETRNIFREAKVEHEWNWHEERRRRSPDIPYVIHYDERHEYEGYQDVTLTYYDGDDVLCNERDEIIDPSERDALVGEKNLERFGHGSNDAAIVYIRNDVMEIVYEVVKSPNSYAEEVHGFAHDAYDRGNIERMRARERDERED